MVKKWFLQTHKIPWIRSSYKNPTEGVEMAPERAWKTSARDWKWTKSPEDWHGLQLAEELPKPSSNNSSYWTTAAWSSVLTNPALPNRSCSQQVIILLWLLYHKCFFYLIQAYIWLWSFFQSNNDQQLEHTFLGVLKITSLIRCT